MNIILMTLGLIAVLLVAITAYYLVKLLKVSRSARDNASRFQAFTQQQLLMQTRMDALDGETVVPKGLLGAPESGAPAVSDTVTSAGVGLSELSSGVVFLARDSAGDVSVQMGDRPPAPLTYVLDPKLRQVLQRIVSQATLSFGYSWSILANEDNEGRLHLRRLS
ncbi:MAG: hypothetical protein GX604_05585 [Actinobacteria bacterium]|nr:hypothetical protein [Actinomycetota bacterium]